MNILFVSFSKYRTVFKFMDVNSSTSLWAHYFYISFIISDLNNNSYVFINRCAAHLEDSF